MKKPLKRPQANPAPLKASAASAAKSAKTTPSMLIGEFDQLIGESVSTSEVEVLKARYGDLGAFALSLLALDEAAKKSPTDGGELP